MVLPATLASLSAGKDARPPKPTLPVSTTCGEATPFDPRPLHPRQSAATLIAATVRLHQVRRDPQAGRAGRLAASASAASASAVLLQEQERSARVLQEQTRALLVHRRRSCAGTVGAGADAGGRFFRAVAPADQANGN